MNLFIISTLFSFGHILVIIAALIFFFGGKKIPEVMGGIGKGIKEFKKSLKDDEKPAETSKGDDIRK